MNTFVKLKTHEKRLFKPRGSSRNLNWRYNTSLTALTATTKVEEESKKALTEGHGKVKFCYSRVGQGKGLVSKALKEDAERH